MSSKQITTEHFLYTLALVLALGIRLLNLGATPLTDAEAGWALHALELSQGACRTGECPAFGAQPAYVFLTEVTFSLFGSSNFAARFWPALLGGCLAIVPYFFRRFLGRKAALILAFGLALDPGLVAVSRQAGSPMLAVGFGLLALGLGTAGRMLLAGAFAGLALLSGPAILQGLFGLALAWAAVSTLERSVTVFSPDASEGRERSIAWPEGARLGLAALVVALLAAGTFFFRFPQGLGAWAATLPAYLSGWAEPSGVPALRLAASLAVYQPLALLFAMGGIVQVWRARAWENSGGIKAGFGRRMSLWLIFALVLALLYPGRQVSDLAWVLVPLWALASIGLADLWPAESGGELISLAQAALVFVLLALIWLNVAGLSYAEPGVQAFTLRLGLIGGVVALAGLTTALVALGWSPQIARDGLLWGSTAALALYLLSATWYASLFNPAGRADIQEIWNPAPAIGDADLLLNTLGDLSAWQTGRRDAIDVTIEVESPALRWALRDYPQARFIPEYESLALSPGRAAGGLPAIIITRQDQAAPSLAAAYRGQDFAWWLRPGWVGALPSGFFRWLAFRQAPTQPEQLILWARGDLFPGGELAPDQNSPPPALENLPLEGEPSE